MRQLRFYIPLPFDVNRQYELPENTARHMVRVLRLNQGEEVILFNGDNYEYLANLVDVSKKSVLVEVTHKTFRDKESPLKTHLVQSLSKGEKMEATIQKSVELGVSAITPVSSERSNVSLSGQRLDKKMSHWQGVIQSACEQCGRNVIPTLNELQSLESVLGALKDAEGLKLLLSPCAAKSLKGIASLPEQVTVLIGPEGGFSDTEVERAHQCGFVAVQAGPRVLRTETAGPAVLSMLQLLWGDFA